jgi:hypothetical protein
MKKIIATMALAAAGWAADPNDFAILQKPPGGLAPEKVPMFVCFAFDDNGRVEGLQWFQNLAKARKNPAGSGNPATFDGASVKGSFFLTANYATNDGFVEQGASSVSDLINVWKALYQDGHEIGNHTWSHPHGAGLDLAGWKAEISQANDFLIQNVGVAPKDLRGFRTPFLEYSATTLEALKSLGFTYDCSIEFGFTGWTPLTGDTGYWNGMTDPKTHQKMFWPWPLDNGSPPGNAAKGNPIVPGLHEVPVFTYMKEAGGEVTGIDFNLWLAMDKATFVATLKKEFDLRRSGNRNPLTISMHSDYYTQYNDDAKAAFTLSTWQERQKAIEEFADYVLSFPETRVVTYAQMLDWIAKPVALSGEAGAVKSPKVLNQAALSMKLSSDGKVDFNLPSPGRYQITLATAAGKTLARASRAFIAGPVRVDAGRALNPGIYFVRIGDGVNEVTRKAVLR